MKKKEIGEEMKKRLLKIFSYVQIWFLMVISYAYIPIAFIQWVFTGKTYYDWLGDKLFEVSTRYEK